MQEVHQNFLAKLNEKSSKDANYIQFLSAYFEDEFNYFVRHPKHIQYAKIDLIEGFEGVKAILKSTSLKFSDFPEESKSNSKIIQKLKEFGRDEFFKHINVFAELGIFELSLLANFLFNNPANPAYVFSFTVFFRYFLLVG